jgi:hypothetical protein
MTCYCDDCQAYLHHLGRADLLDAHGGTDIVQVAPAALSFHQGAELLSGVRLTPKGLYRWYTQCCHTPMGNTLTPSLPFVGIAAQAFAEDGAAVSVDAYFGRSRGMSFGKFAIGAPPPGSVRPNLGMLAHALRKVLGWKLRGRAWPHPFFERDTSSPRYPVRILTREERAALRPLCGPRESPRTAT